MIRAAVRVGQPAGSTRPRFGLIIEDMMFVIRYGIGSVMVVAGIVLLVISPAGLGVDGFALAAGGGLSVVMFNYLYRLGVSGDQEREREEDARRYLEEHGEWPEDDPPQPTGRKWVLPAGVVTPEDEARRRTA